MTITTRQSTVCVPHTAQQMFDLVADVERYPQFIPWCVALRVASRQVRAVDELVIADMVVAYRVFRERFRSRVTLDRSARTIDVEYVDGPFRALTNSWRFTENANAGSTVDFEIAFEFRNFVLQTTAQAVFEKAFAKMADAFVTRAGVIYSASPPPSPPQPTAQLVDQPAALTGLGSDGWGGTAT